MKKSWKTLAWPMFSMNLWFSSEFPGTSRESMKFNEFMENIGLANVFHEFVVFQRISWDCQESMNSWKTLAWPMFSMNFHEKIMENIGLANVCHEFYSFSENLLISAVNEFMENIGLANVFHCFFMNLRSSMASRKMLSLTAQANTQEMMVVRV